MVLSSVQSAVLICLMSFRGTGVGAWTVPISSRRGGLVWQSRSFFWQHFSKLSASKGPNEDDDDETPRAGTFFNQVPATNKNEETRNPVAEANVFDLIQKSKQGILDSSIKSAPSSSINDPRRPEYDDQGFTLYANATTGEKSRVLDALVDYPCTFTLKIVGLNEETFVTDMLETVATSCDVSTDKIKHSVRVSAGKQKYISLTVKTPIESAEMLYQLYADVDKDHRVKFKF